MCNLFSYIKNLFVKQSSVKELSSFAFSFGPRWNSFEVSGWDYSKEHEVIDYFDKEPLGVCSNKACGLVLHIGNCAWTKNYQTKTIDLLCMKCFYGSFAVVIDAGYIDRKQKYVAQPKVKSQVHFIDMNGNITSRDADKYYAEEKQKAEYLKELRDGQN